MMKTSDYNELNLKDVTTIVEEKLKNKKFEIISYELSQVHEDSLTEHQRLKVIVQIEDENEPKNLSFFLKYYPSTLKSVQFAQNTGGFEKEIFTYEDLFNKIITSRIELLKECTVKYHLTFQNKMLVFEDLEQKGFQVSKNFELDVGIVQVVLKGLAKLHASSLIYEEYMSIKLNRAYRIIEDNEKKFNESFYNSEKNFINLKGVKASIKGILTEIDYFKQTSPLRSGKNFKTVAEECCYKVFSLIKQSYKYRNVISHGNLWFSNFLIKLDENKMPISCKFVDFQTIRYVPPSHDVMAFLHLTTSREFRQRNLYKLVGLYYNYLEAHLKIAGYELKNLIPFNDFLNSCEEQKAFALTQAATYFQIMFLDKDALNYFFSNIVLSDYTFNRDRSLIILTYISKFEFYRKKLLETILDLRDYCDYL